MFDLDEKENLLARGSYCSLLCALFDEYLQGFELKLVFRMRTPDSTNNGGEGFAIVFQQVATASR